MRHHVTNTRFVLGMLSKNIKQRMVVKYAMARVQATKNTKLANGKK